jgi:hypothetical protein
MPSGAAAWAAGAILVANRADGPNPSTKAVVSS